MSVVVTYISNLTVKETLETNVPAAEAAKRIVTHDQFNFTDTLNSGTPDPVTKVAAFEVTLSAGTATIDLTTLTGTNGVTVDGSGLKVQVAKFKNKNGNVAVMSVVDGVTNGYDGFGTNFEINLLPNAEVLFLLKDQGADISGTNKTLDIAGSGVEVLQVELVMG